MTSDITIKSMIFS